uniref:Large ribosomal subunit protein bL34m n=1 Tax=Mus spicilegus TaxID=10103 RepID=A0A8C6MW77_MUSSI
MAFLARCFGCQACRSVLSGRYLQSRVWMGLPDSWPLLSLQQARGRVRGNEYQPSNIKRKHKHGWVRRLSTPVGVQVILRRAGRKHISIQADMVLEKELRFLDLDPRQLEGFQRLPPR